MESAPSHVWENKCIIPKNSTSNINYQLMNGHPFVVTSVIPEVVLHFRIDLYNFLFAKGIELDMDYRIVAGLYELDSTALGPIPDEYRYWRTNAPIDVERINSCFINPGVFDISGSDLRAAVYPIFRILFDETERYTFRTIITTTGCYAISTHSELNRRGNIIFRTPYNKIEYEYLADFWSEVVEEFLTLTEEHVTTFATKYGVLMKNNEDYTPLQYLHFHFPGCIQKRPEIEVIQEMGVYCVYDTYDNLLHRAATITKGKKNVFIVLHDRIALCAVNQTLLTLETVVEACPSIVFGFGNTKKFHAFSVPEMLGSFSEDICKPGFFKPFSIDEEFTDETIKEINILLMDYEREYPEALELRNKIHRVSNQKRYSDALFKETLSKYKSLKASQKKHVAAFFENLFFAGMYMRQWRGDPHPYPRHADETKYYADDLSFYKNVTDLLLKAGTLLRKYPFLGPNPIMEFGFGRILKTEDTIKTYLKDVMNERKCIRMASTGFVITAHYYARAFGLNNVPVIKPEEYQPIL